MIMEAHTQRTRGAVCNSDPRKMKAHCSLPYYQPSGSGETGSSAYCLNSFLLSSFTGRMSRPPFPLLAYPSMHVFSHRGSFWTLRETPDETSSGSPGNTTGFSPVRFSPAHSAWALFSVSLLARILLPLGRQGGQKWNQVLSTFSPQAVVRSWSMRSGSLRQEQARHNWGSFSPLGGEQSSLGSKEWDLGSGAPHPAGSQCRAGESDGRITFFSCNVNERGSRCCRGHPDPSWFAFAHSWTGSLVRGWRGKWAEQPRAAAGRTSIIRTLSLPPFLTRALVLSTCFPLCHLLVHLAPTPMSVCSWVTKSLPFPSS